MIQIGTKAIFDVAEVSTKFGLTAKTLRKYINEGKLAGRKMGQRWYISEEGISDFFRKPQPKPLPGNSKEGDRAKK